MHTIDSNDVFGLLGVSRGFLFRLFSSATPRVEAEPAAYPATRIRPYGWLERIDRWASRARQHDIEAYLGQAHDIYELERRIRDLERASSSWPY